MKARCRHEQNSWVLGGIWQWCYRCGALQKLERLPDGMNGSFPVTGWLKPVGLTAENPGTFPERRKR